MDNETIPEKSWWQKNRIWFVPATVVLIIGILLLSQGNIGDMAQSYADPIIYDNALHQAKTDTKVLQIMGSLSPIDKMAMLEGTVAYSNGNNSVNISVRVMGDKASGKMDITANRKGKEWEYEKINIRVKKPAAKKQTIVIVPAPK